MYVKNNSDKLSCSLPKKCLPSFVWAAGCQVRDIEGLSFFALMSQGDVSEQDFKSLNQHQPQKLTQISEELCPPSQTSSHDAFLDKLYKNTRQVVTVSGKHVGFEAKQSSS